MNRVWMVSAAIVVVVGCAGKTAAPHIWELKQAGARLESSRAGITTSEKDQLAKQPLGQNTYQLIGVADFVDAQTSASIGDRAKILTPSRVNATGMLVSGHKVAVKGLLIDASPPRINLTSVVDLGSCPSHD
ncbi:MAG: hypothetical protein AUJ01_14395 [Acidobacteria bacterium 13_1_40CM_3_65_5]|nr:MAG: hypothetical protein AUH72_12495 [Acidobacteria bacterium 13_1_40CM_4_65_8]OLD14112.1 MAG: hypothetical protein AUJ01_14395 [Acidobacteria bacterium 13_1_40CM_3_65_5]